MDEAEEEVQWRHRFRAVIGRAGTTGARAHPARERRAGQQSRGAL